MRKEDYMRLPKERLAELLEERDNMSHTPTFPPIQITPPNPPCYAPDGTCMNPQQDCIGCPKLWSTGGSWATDMTFKGEK